MIPPALDNLIEFTKRDVRGWKDSESGRVWYNIQFYHKDRRKPKRTEELWQCPECGRHNLHRIIEENHRHATPSITCTRCGIEYSRKRDRTVGWPLARVTFMMVNRRFPTSLLDL